MAASKVSRQSKGKIVRKKKTAEEKLTEQVMLRAMQLFNMFHNGQAITFMLNKHIPEGQGTSSSSEHVMVKLSESKVATADSGFVQQSLLEAKNVLHQEKDAIVLNEVTSLVKGGRRKRVSKQKVLRGTGSEEGKEQYPEDPLTQLKNNFGGQMLQIKEKHDKSLKIPMKDPMNTHKKLHKKEANQGTKAKVMKSTGKDKETKNPRTSGKIKAKKAEQHDEFELSEMEKPQLEYAAHQRDSLENRLAKSPTKQKEKKRVAGPKKLHAVDAFQDKPADPIKTSSRKALYRSGYFLAIPMLQFLSTAAVMGIMYNLHKSLSLSLASTITSLIMSLAIYESRRHVYDTKDSLAMIGLFVGSNTIMFATYHFIKTPKCYDCIAPMNAVESLVTAMATFGFFSILRPL